MNGKGRVDWWSFPWDGMESIGLTHVANRPTGHEVAEPNEDRPGDGWLLPVTSLKDVLDNNDQVNEDGHEQKPLVPPQRRFRRSNCLLRQRPRHAVKH